MNFPALFPRPAGQTRVRALAAWRLLAVWALGLSSAGAQVLSLGYNPQSRAGRFAEGTSSVPDDQSFILTLDFQQGIPLDRMGASATVFGAITPNPWVNQIAKITRLHYPYDLAFENPLAAFGAASGGTPLLIGRSYAFGTFSGTGLSFSHTTTTNPDQYRIKVFRRSDFTAGATNVAPVDVFTWNVPDSSDPAVWSQFLASGGSMTIEGDGLQTVLQINDLSSAGWQAWGLQFVYPAISLRHLASAAATDYFYVVEAQGGRVRAIGRNVMLAAMAIPQNSSGGDNWVPLYALDFSPAGANQATILQQPPFTSGEPLPPEYEGKSLDELLNDAPPVTTPVALDPANCLALDASPELRRHPVLDQFVADRDADPVALANYVLNEVRLINPVAPSDDGNFADASINEGGLDRGALAVLQEGCGSPSEQCALLVYLLRQGGVPAAYIYPERNSLKLLDSRVSTLLGTQIHGALDATGKSNVPRLVPVNYPWVAAYVDGKWVHLFPWLKDMEIIEGQNLYDLLPPGYDSSFKILRAFLHNDPFLFDAASHSSAMGDVLDDFLTRAIQQGHPGVSLDQVGVRVRQRTGYHARFEDFPRPFAVGANSTARTNLGDTPQVFNTVSVLLTAGSGPLASTGTLRIADLHNRCLLARTEQVGPQELYIHRLHLHLEALRPGTQYTGAFADDPDLIRAQEINVPLDFSDDRITAHVIHDRQRTVDVFPVPQDANVFLQVHTFREVACDTTFRRGDAAAFCFDLGQVSERMMAVHAQNLWNQQSAQAANPSLAADPNVLWGDAAYLLAQTFFSRDDAFREKLARLHKNITLSEYQVCLATLGALHDPATGLLPNGNVIPAVPQVDINASLLYGVSNDTIHADSGQQSNLGYQDFLNLYSVGGSSDEHACINQMFGVTDAISTTRLLQLAQERADAGTLAQGILELNQFNYTGIGNQTYEGGVTLANRDTNVWAAVSYDMFPGSTYGGRDYYGFITPGAILNSSGTRQTVAALLLNGLSHSFAALIGGNLAHGGRGSALPDGFFNPANNQTSLQLDSKGRYVLALNPPGTGTDLDQITPGQAAQAVNDLRNGTAPVSPYDESRFNAVAAKYGYTPTGDPDADHAALLSIIQQRGPDNGIAGFVKDATAFVFDPVNSVTGEFHLDAVDLRLGGPMPLEVRRNYGSLSLTQGQFGPGWKSAYAPSLTVSLDESVISAADPDGSVIAYRADPLQPGLWWPTAADNPTLSNVNGRSAGGLGNTFHNQISKTVSDAGAATYVLAGADGSVRTYPVLSFPTADGFAHQQPYLTRWQDNRGNALTFSYGRDAGQPDYGQMRRAASTNGDYLGFRYDVYGHIAEAYTGDGQHLAYEYDGYGDLVKVTLPDASEVGFDYEHGTFLQNGVAATYSKHLLIRERKPEGHVLENDYDDQRRVIVQRAPVGQDLRPVANATFAYSQAVNPDGTLSGNTVVRDAYQRPTRFDYAAGQITAVTDPLNQVDTRTWYQPGDTTPGAYPRSLKSETDKRGLLTEFKYDGQGNVSEVKFTGDLTGSGHPAEVATTTTVYNALNLPASVTDPAGNAVLTFYEDPIYPFLPTRSERRAPGGGLVSTIARTYTSATEGARASYGLLDTLKAAAGSPDEAVTAWTYRADGYPATQTRQTGTADPAVAVRLVHDGRGQLIERTDSDNRQQQFAYDALGNRIWQETRESDGHLLGWAYDYFDGNGQPTWHQGSRYNPGDYAYQAYDGAGRATQTTRWRSQAKADGSGVEAPPGDVLTATTTNAYDLFGDLALARDPRGNETALSYDMIGQLKERRSYQGSADAGALLSQDDFDYEPGGLVQAATNAKGGVTRKFYTARGQVYRQENPDGSVLKWQYGLDGRLALETRSDGSAWSVAYDDLNRTVTRTLTGRGGNILAATSLTLDRRGNAVSRTDEENNVFTTAYDGLDRIKAATGPGATASSARQRTTYTYDGSGRVTRSRNALGETTTTTTDALRRPVTVVIADAAGNAVRQSSFVYSADHQAVTVTEGSGPGAVSTTRYTDLAGAPLLTQYSTGEFTAQSYDLSGNLAASRDALGQVTAFDHDGLNRPVLTTLPDGAQTTLVYDGLGDLLERRMPAGLSVFASFDNAGRIQTERLHGGSADSRQVTYTYYPADSPFAGLRQSAANARGITHTITYDDFLRVGAVQSAGPTPELSLTTAYGYDRCSRLTSVAQNPGSPATGPPTYVSRTPDAYGQTTEEIVSAGGSVVSDLTQRWDGAGRRARLSSRLPIQGLGAGTQFDYFHSADGNLSEVRAAGVAGAFDYDYGDNGLLLDRRDPWRTLTVDARDGRGRATWQTSRAAGGGGTLVETVGWRGDSTLGSYGAVRTGGSGASSEARGYGYNARGQLLQESFAPSSGQAATLGYGFDADARPGGLGIRTRAQAAEGFSFSALGVDPLGRVYSEASNAEPQSFTAAGQARGAASVEARVDGVPAGPPAYAGQSSAAGDWSLPLRLPPGPHTLTVTAHHPSGAFNPQAASAFTVNPTAAAATLTTGYDGVGNVASRTVSGGGRSQTLAWDALDRLVAVTQRDNGQSGGDGCNWNAVYDGLGRRLQTTAVPVAGGAALPGAALTITSTFDPQAEFLEVGVAVQNGSAASARRLWKVYGPDLGGAAFGSLQGTGGLEAVVREGDGAALGMVNTWFGDAAGTVALGGAVNWNPVPYGGYGALLGKGAPTYLGLLAAGQDNLLGLAAATGWRGRRMDETGFYGMGARTYEPAGGRFLSADPLGHGSSPSLYDYAGGDPINGLDPDGRCVTQSASQLYNTVGRGVDGMGQLVLAGDDTINLGSLIARDAIFGTNDAGSYRGDSKYYQGFYDHPGSFDESKVRSGIIDSGLDAVNNTITLGAYGLITGAVDTYQTGNWNSLQDGAFGMLAASSLYKLSLAPTNCFPSGTLVLMADGSGKPVDEVEPGEWVLGEDPTQPETLAAYRVEAQLHSRTKHLVTVDVEDSSGHTGQINATREHPFWVKGGGWRFAMDLTTGDNLMDKDGRDVKVLGTHVEEVSTATFNLSIDARHTFFVVTNGITALVHNASPNDVGTVRTLNGGANVNDNLAAHELLQAAKLKVDGLGGRGSTIQLDNPAIALDNFSHGIVTGMQNDLRMHDPSVLSKMSPEAVIDINHQILEAASKVPGTNIDLNAARQATSDAMDYAATICP